MTILSKTCAWTMVSHQCACLWATGTWKSICSSQLPWTQHWQRPLGLTSNCLSLYSCHAWRQRQSIRLIPCRVEQVLQLGPQKWNCKPDLSFSGWLGDTAAICRQPYLDQVLTCCLSFSNDSSTKAILWTSLSLLAGASSIVTPCQDGFQLLDK
jgi:hypothetical protein